MEDYQNLRNVLEKTIEYIERNIVENSRVYSESKEYYNENYMNYMHAEFLSFHGKKFKMKEENFDEVYNYNIEFLKEQVDFMKKILELNYMKNQYNLSKYTEKVFKEFVRTIKNEYVNICNHNYILTICDRTNIAHKYNCLLLLEKFSSIEENIILIGGNGSGKSSLANILKSYDTEYIAVVPAQKNLYFSLRNPGLLTTEKSELIRMLFENNIAKGKDSENYVGDYFEFQNNQFTKLILGMISEYTQYLYKCSKMSVLPNQEDTVFGKLQKVFAVIFPDIELECSSEQGLCLKCRKHENTYLLNGLSEGEKVVIYYTISVLLAKKESIIIIDEPETYMNPSLTNCLWDILTSMRSDCQFIFITHSVDFILGRGNAKIAWIKSYKYPHEWEFEILNSEEKIPKTLLTEILGSQKSVVFCEGTDKSSLDYHIYKAILEKDFTIIPVEGHRKVIECCRAVNKMNVNYKAYGIIDGDNYSEGQRKCYFKDNIFILPFNEIEMFLINDIIMGKIMSILYPQDYSVRIEKFKEVFWEKMKLRKNKIVLSYTIHLVNEYLETEKIEKVDSLSNIKESLKKIDSLDIDLIFEEKKSDIENILNNEDYDAALKVCNLKKEITKEIAVKYLDKDYEEKVKQHIMVNSDLQNCLKKEYFNMLYFNDEDFDR